jgi:hypothetical protein
VSFKENANAGSLIQPALQFSHIEKRFPMLTEGSTMEYSLLFSLESLCECYGWFAAAFWPDFCKGWTCVWGFGGWSVTLHFVEGVHRKASNRLVGISRKVYSRLSDIEDSSRSRASKEKEGQMTQTIRSSVRFLDGWRVGIFLRLLLWVWLMLSYTDSTFLVTFLFKRFSVLDGFHGSIQQRQPMPVGCDMVWTVGTFFLRDLFKVSYMESFGCGMAWSFFWVRDPVAIELSGKLRGLDDDAFRLLASVPRHILLAPDVNSMFPDCW